MVRVGFVASSDSVARVALWTRNLKRENWAARRRVSLSEDEEGQGEEGSSSEISQYRGVGRAVEVMVPYVRVRGALLCRRHRVRRV
jgi:hypothetical protein